MAKATCTSCGERFTFDEYDEFHEPWCGPTCCECSKAAEAGEVLDVSKVASIYTNIKGGKPVVEIEPADLIEQSEG